MSSTDLQWSISPSSDTCFPGLGGPLGYAQLYAPNFLFSRHPGGRCGDIVDFLGVMVLRRWWIVVTYCGVVVAVIG